MKKVIKNLKTGKFICDDNQAGIWEVDNIEDATLYKDEDFSDEELIEYINSNRLCLSPLEIVHVKVAYEIV